MRLKALSLFSGVGAWESALKNLGIEIDLVGYSEIDKYASKAFSLMHGVSETLNLGDITKIDETKLPDIDIVTYSPPCQAFSTAGLKKGTDDPRGVLFFDALRIIRAKRPKYAIMENVKNLTGKQFAETFSSMLTSLRYAGYRNYWKVLNATDYGVPQNRERVFIVSIREDIDTGYTFPRPIKLEKRLKDVLEQTVDDKYYLSEQCVKGFLQHNVNHNKKGTGFLWTPKTSDEIASCLRANSSLCATDNTLVEEYDTARIMQLAGNLYPNSGNPQAGRIYDVNGISPSLDTCAGGNRMPKILEKTFLIGASRGRNPENPGDRTAGIPTEQRLEINLKGVTNTLTTVPKDNYVIELDNETLVRFRRLTPLECFRLMGFSDEEFARISGELSNTQLYKIAGNSSVVDVLYAIFKNLFFPDANVFVERGLF